MIRSGSRRALDAARELWYFSTMAGATMVRRIDFHRTKYGRDLLVDAAFTTELRNFHLEGRPHSLTFYDILLITRGRGSFVVLLNRWYATRHGAEPPRPPKTTVDRFVALFERDFRRRHRVEDYARELGLTPGHLNALCREHLGCSAGAALRRRITLEARRLLLYSDRPAASVAYHLSFDDPSYFSRFFRRETGLTPARFRAQFLAASGSISARSGVLPFSG